MNRLLGTLAALLLLAGCSAPASEPAEPAVTASSDSTTDAPEPAESPSEEAPAEESPEEAAGQYGVTIDGSRQTKDYEGKKSLAVDFTFTNNSDEAANFMFAVSAKAFQDGIELERAIVTGDKKFDSGNSMKDIKPGKSIKVQEAYVLDGKADVVIEVTELISFDDTLLATKTISLK